METEHHSKTNILPEPGRARFPLGTVRWRGHADPTRPAALTAPVLHVSGAATLINLAKRARAASQPVGKEIFQS
ncbi:MAG: hypothetical protein WC003_01185 [Terrimicrobiaceae bacterium]